MLKAIVSAALLMAALVVSGFIILNKVKPIESELDNRILSDAKWSWVVVLLGAALVAFLVL